jgi:hypothetical protein
MRDARARTSAASWLALGVILAVASFVKLCGEKGTPSTTTFALDTVSQTWTAARATSRGIGSGLSDSGARNLPRVAMNSQGQGGRDVWGQRGVQLKGAKKRAVGRARKLYGSHGARKVPRRYPLYDILEMIDSTVPTYTVISEPKDPMMPVEKVPLLKRYPWAGDLTRVHGRKKKEEDGLKESRMEPFFGSWTGAGLPPKGRRQGYIARRGFPTYNHPPWLNRPLIGEEVWVPGNMSWKKHRSPQPWQLKPKKRQELEAKLLAEAKARAASDEDMDAMDEELEALGS